MPFALRFMADLNISGGSWVELPGGSYKLASPTALRTYCQVEVFVPWDKIVSHPAEGAYSKLAPLRILSIDIECAGRKVRTRVML